MGTALNNTAVDREDALVTINVLANDTVGSTLFSLGTLGAPAVISITTASGALVKIVGSNLTYDPSASAVLNRSGTSSPWESCTATVPPASYEISTSSPPPCPGPTNVSTASSCRSWASLMPK